MKRIGKKRGGPRPRALIIEDDRAIAKLIDFNLSGAGFDPRRVTTGEEALHSVAREPTELVVLDLALPGIDGLTVCRRLKDDAQTRAIPILIVSARGEEEDVIAGLEIGADDYVTKPFSPRELVARVKAIIRRSYGQPNEQPHESYEKGWLRIDFDTHEVSRDDEPVELGLREFDLLKFFVRNPRRVFGRSQILDRVWGHDVYVEPRTVDVHIRRLRQRIERDDTKPTLLLTVRGVGYKFNPDALEND